MPRVRLSQRARRRQARAAALLIAGLAAGVFCAWQFGDRFAATIHPGARLSDRDLPRAVALSPTPLTDDRPIPPPSPIYPYSVVSGGVHSVEELKIAMRFDPVVAAHFADFDLSRTRIERVSVSRAVYVSYRQGDRVRWTSRRLTLRPGETLLTDGQNQARTRCGNRITEIAPAEITKEEPPPETLETPLPSRTIPFDPLVGYEMFEATGEMPAQDIILPSAPLLAMTMTELPLPDVPQPPLIPVIPFGDIPPEIPEPGTLLLVSSALGVYAVVRRARRR